MEEEPDVSSCTCAELCVLQGRGVLRAIDIARASLAQIEALNPRTRAVIELNPDAEAIAVGLDEERHAGRVRGPLHGIPILLKDNIDTADPMCTTAGSLALEGVRARADASLVRRLREAGALLIGKTNLSEWANIRSLRSSSGWSSRGGQTRNPHALNRSPGGSSAGSGVAVACGMCTVAIGTETDGSIMSPASLNGVVGIKPSLGLVSQSGIIPIAHSQDTAGPMARTVADAALALLAMVEAYPDGLGFPNPSGAGDPAWDEGALRGTRIGIVRSYCGFHRGVDAVFDEAIDALRECGAVVVDEVALVTHRELAAPEMQVFLHELKADLNAYLERLGPESPVHSLADVIGFNEAHAARTMPYFGQELFVAAQETRGLDAPEYREALSTCRRLAREEGIDAALAKHRLDALFLPTAGPAWVIDLVNGDGHAQCSSAPAAVAGYPSVSVPGGDVHGLPIGVSFVGAARSDARVIGFAYAFESVTAARRAPPLVESI